MCSINQRLVLTNLVCMLAHKITRWKKRWIKN
jgi:hypothetical protein